MFLFNLFRRKKRHIKIGLALGSGGAKGYAELGILSALKENDIEFDVITGTSIGSVVGAFIANGYSSCEILDLIKGIDFGEVFSKVMVNMDTDGLLKVIDREIGNINIEELKKPFCAVATEFISGEEYAFYKGSVAKALCASCSYPPFFKPIEIDGKRYLDGAFCNSIPADKARELGADFVIGVDLSDHQTKNSILSRIFPTYQGKTETPWDKGYEHSNIMLAPPLSGYKATSFRYAEEMYDIGYEYAMTKMPEIKMAIKNFKLKKKHGKKNK